MISKLILVIQLISLTFAFNLPLKANLNSDFTVKCKICNLVIDRKYYIPENCTIPYGCPYNIKSENNYIFKG
jgi:hypothetical protein|uniref:Uncharacterized protein n=1 Tax=viral metagenome TaxID=1070528 RepID=A0A6C0JNF2_9ZZZZ